MGAGDDRRSADATSRRAQRGAVAVGSALTALRVPPPLRAWWRALAPRERALVGVAAAVLALFVVWAVAIAPAWRTLATAVTERDAQQHQLQSMQRLADEAAALRATPRVDRERAAAALRAATVRLGTQGSMQLQGDRAVLTVNDVSTQALGDWLAEARAGARAQPVDANLVRGAGGFSGSVVVAIGGGG